MNEPSDPSAQDAVTHRVDVAMPPPQAFDLFVRGTARWWPFKGHSCGGNDAADVHFEEHVVGAVTEITRQGDRHHWGTLLIWQPPHRLVMTWHPGQDAARATRLELRFEASLTGCVLHLCHDGWAARGVDAEEVRGGYQQGWAVVLQRWAAQTSKE